MRCEWGGPFLKRNRKLIVSRWRIAWFNVESEDGEADVCEKGTLCSGSRAA